jgi:hypothetical protein
MHADVFQDKLLAGERVVWSGRPAQGILFTPRDILMIPFSLLWGGFAIFWETTVVTAGAPWFFALWGVPFVAAGLMLIFGRFLIDAYLRERLYYAITDRRVLIARMAPFAAFTSIALESGPPVHLVSAGGGRGTIAFGLAPRFGRNNVAAWIPSLSSTPQFIAIENAQAVVNLISGGGGLHAGAGAGLRSGAVTASSGGQDQGWRIAGFAAVGFVVLVTIAYRSFFCFGSGGAGLHAARSFATTEASFNVGDRTPVTRFGPDDTAMALLILNWPVSARNGGSHRIRWNWYRDGRLVYSVRRCHMAFATQPFSLWTWRTARELGGGHVRVDTLIDGEIAGSTEFDVAAPVSTSNQGAVSPGWSCG